MLPVIILALTAQKSSATPTSIETLFDACIATPNSKAGEIKRAKSGYAVSVKEGLNARPGIKFTPKKGMLDLTATPSIAANIWNSGQTALELTVRIENPGTTKTPHWTESKFQLSAGKAMFIQVNFGPGHQSKREYPLNPAKISAITFIANPTDGAKLEGSRAFTIATLTSPKSTQLKRKARKPSSPKKPSKRP